MSVPRVLVPGSCSIDSYHEPVLETTAVVGKMHHASWAGVSQTTSEPTAEIRGL